MFITAAVTVSATLLIATFLSVPTIEIRRHSRAGSVLSRATGIRVAVPAIAITAVLGGTIVGVASHRTYQQEQADRNRLAAAAGVSVSALPDSVPDLGEPFALKYQGEFFLCRAVQNYDRVECLDEKNWLILGGSPTSDK